MTAAGWWGRSERAHERRAESPPAGGERTHHGGPAVGERLVVRDRQGLERAERRPAAEARGRKQHRAEAGGDAGDERAAGAGGVGGCGGGGGGGRGSGRGGGSWGRLGGGSVASCLTPD